MIGLKRGTVELVSYTKEWQLEFEQSKENLDSLLTSIHVQIEHIGSTSIPNISSKPILDIGLGVNSQNDINKIINILTNNGYVDRGDQGSRGGYLLVKEIKPDVVSHHIHILLLSDIQWKNYLLFRDKLKSDINLRQEYEALKKELFRFNKGNRENYTNGKNDFIKRVIREGQSSVS